MPLIDETTLDLPQEPALSGRKPRWLTTLVLVSLVLIIFLGVSAAFLYLKLYLPGKAFLGSIQKFEESARLTQQFTKSQDLKGLSDHLTKLQTELATLEVDYQNKFSWIKGVPYAKDYYLDGENAFIAAKHLFTAGFTTIDTIAPYADLVGLKGFTPGAPGDKTAQDRINFLVTTIDKLLPKLNDVGSELSAAQVAISTIDPSRYPEKYNNQPIREKITEGKDLLIQASQLVNEARPVLESIPYLLGVDKPRKYLVLFQNDAELRPTGGFLTGYAIVGVAKGKITVVQSDDIYGLDAKFPKRIVAPDPIKKYHPLVPYWYLRDQNLSPDFKVSMDTFYPNYKLTKSPEVDGILAVDTQLLVKLLQVTGKIGVPGYGNFSSETDVRCNCPNVFYQLQVLAGAEEPVVWDTVSGKIVKAPANYGNRKQFLGPVMYSILANVISQPKSKLPQLFRVALSAIDSKDLLAYFPGEKIQSAMESFNLAGRVGETDGDYLMVVDTNFSGGKTNIWVKYSADQKIEVSADGEVTKTLTLNYSNPEDSTVKIETGRNLNGLFRDWLRIYVPKGSELIEASGFETGQLTSEDLGKTVFEGFFTLAPANNRIIKLKYKLPLKLKSPYKLLIQKQPGAKEFIYNTTINSKKQPEQFLSKDLQLSLSY